MKIVLVRLPTHQGGLDGFHVSVMSDVKVNECIEIGYCDSQDASRFDNAIHFEKYTFAFETFNVLEQMAHINEINSSIREHL